MDANNGSSLFGRHCDCTGGDGTAMSLLGMMDGMDVVVGVAGVVVVIVIVVSTNDDDDDDDDDNDNVLIVLVEVVGNSCSNRVG
jgi:hypothetical protein